MGRLKMFSRPNWRNYCLSVESMETRNLFAAMVSHNIDRPYDVDGDGQLAQADYDMLVSGMRESGRRFGGSRSTKSLGDAQASPDGPPYYDVNGDGRVSIVDLLGVVNAMNADSPPTDSFRWGPDGQYLFEPSQPAVWEVDSGGNGHEYVVVFQPNEPLNYDNASLLAESMIYAGRRGHLATITSQAEQEFIGRNLLKSHSGVFSWVGFIGLSDSENRGGFESYDQQDRQRDGWRWSTNEPIDYVNWSRNQPNNGIGDRPFEADSDAVVISSLDGKWNDVSERGRMATFLIEFEGN